MNCFVIKMMETDTGDKKDLITIDYHTNITEKTGRRLSLIFMCSYIKTNRQNKVFDKKYV